MHDNGGPAASSPGTRPRAQHGVVVTQRAMFDGVFNDAEIRGRGGGNGGEGGGEGGGGGEGAGDPEYLFAVSTEYLRSLSSHGLAAEPFLVDFIISLSINAKPPRYNALHQLLQYHVIADSR